MFPNADEVLICLLDLDLGPTTWRQHVHEFFKFVFVEFVILAKVSLAQTEDNLQLFFLHRKQLAETVRFIS